MGSGKSFFLLQLLILQLQPALFHSIVEFFPGFDGPLPFLLETGYIGVDESEDVQLFYYFFPSENNPKEDPLLLWLVGGPGCSAISAILYEIGPLQFKEVKYNGSLPRLELRPYSWTKMANIIFLDLPVGTGFSYARTDKASYTGDLKASHNANEFLRKWLVDHQEFQSNPVYLGGDSYTGITLPVYFQEMTQGNEMGMQPFINLEGYLLGNPTTNSTYEADFVVPFAHGMGLISDELYESLKRSCKGNYNLKFQVPTNVECISNILSYQKCIKGIYNAHILEPECDFESPNTPPQGSPESLRRSLYQDDSDIITNNHSSSSNTFWCRAAGYVLSAYWLNDESVREAFHVREGSMDIWVRCNYGLNYANDISSSVMYHKHLTSKGYRALIYSGDHDMLVTFLGTQAWIRSLNYSIVDDWRPWLVEAEIAGYTRTFATNLMYATVKVKQAKLTVKFRDGIYIVSMTDCYVHREEGIRRRSTDQKNVTTCSKDGYLGNPFNQFVMESKGLMCMSSLFSYVVYEDQ